MPLRLRPREARFTDRFVVLADGLADGARLLAELLATDQAGREVLARQMRETDQRVEEATHAVLRELAAAFVTPIDRVDVYRLAWALRLCSRELDALVDQTTQFRMGLLPEAITDQVVLVGRAAEATAEAMPRLGRLRAMSQTWLELTRLRKQSAELHRATLVGLTSLGGEPAVQQRLLRVEDGLQAVVAAFEGVAHLLEQIVVKEG